MADASLAVSLSGGVGALLVGMTLATEGAQRALGRTLRGFLESRDERAGTALVLGLSMGACAPATAAQPRAVVALGSAGLQRLGPGLWTALGVVAAVPLWALWVALAPSDLAAALLGLGALVTWLAPGQKAGAWGRLAAGWGLALLGAGWLSEGFLALGHTWRLDAVDLGTSTRLGLAVALGAGATLALRCAAVVVAVTLGAAVGGALGLSTAAALLVGAQCGAGLALWSALGAERGDGRRTAVGVLLAHALALPLGLLLLSLTLPLALARPNWLGDPAVALAAFCVCLWLLTLAFAAPLLGMLRDLLENHFECEQGTGESEPSVDELGAATVESRTQRLTALARSLGRQVLGGQRVSDFRIESDRGEAEVLAHDVDVVLARMQPRPLSRDLGARLHGADRRVRAHLSLMSGLAQVRVQLHMARLPQSGPPASRMHQLRLAALHLLESALAPGARERWEDLLGEARSVNAHLDDLRQGTIYALAQGRSLPDQVEACLDHLTALRSIITATLEVAATEACEWETDDSWRLRLANWLAQRDAETYDPTRREISERVA